MSEKYINYFDSNFELDFFSPSDKLNSYIKNYIYFSFPAEKLNNLFMHPFPNGNFEIYFCLDKSKVLIKRNNTQQYLKAFLIPISELSDQTLVKILTDTEFYRCVLVELKINALNHLFNIPLGRFKNSVVDIDVFWGEKAEELKKIFESAKDIDVIINYLNSFFESFTENIPDHNKTSFYHIINYCIQKEGQLTVYELSCNFKISYRTMFRWFIKEIGITPKEYLKILRFNKVCLLINKYPKMDWSELFYTCGYYDQSHFIHDFKEIIKTTPDQFYKLTNGKFYLKRPYFIAD